MTVTVILACLLGVSILVNLAAMWIMKGSNDHAILMLADQRQVFLDHIEDLQKLAFTDAQERLHTLNLSVRRTDLAQSRTTTDDPTPDEVQGRPPPDDDADDGGNRRWKRP